MNEKIPSIETFGRPKMSLDAAMMNTQQRQPFDLLSKMDKNMKIKFDRNSIMDRKSRSTLQNYTTIQVDRSPNKKMFTAPDASDYSNNFKGRKNLPDLKLPDMSRGSKRNESNPYNFI